MHLIIIPITIFGTFSLLGYPVSFPFSQTIFMSLLALVVLHTIKGKTKGKLKA